MKVPLVDLNAQYLSIKEEIDQAIQRTIDKSQFILGEEVGLLESEVAEYLGAGVAVGVGSGTDALYLSLLACGIKQGDEVITTPFTFIATAEAISRCGAKPVFVDIDPQTFNIDTSKIERKITNRTKAILPVHLYGQPVDMDMVLALSKQYNLRVIEDCAQSFGTRHSTHAACFSFFPSKILGCFGDGGMVVTDEKWLADDVRILRNHGCENKYYHLKHGFNSRLDNLQAAILRAKLHFVDDWVALRMDNAETYSEFLYGVQGIVIPEGEHLFNYYTIRILNGKRDKLQAYLNAQGIGTAVYYPVPLHLQEVYRPLGYKEGDFPESELASKEVLSLPMYPELQDSQIEYVTEHIKRGLVC
jgi:dTDP-4-amino-4,6-dideoxygalactose transaminase